jgi:zinc/manganese transport system ATP-binding protein
MSAHTPKHSCHAHHDHTHHHHGHSDTDHAKAVLRFENVTLGYDAHPAIHHLSGVIAQGSLTAVAGPNGAGKSTLLKGIIGNLIPLQGHIRCALAPDKIAYLPQAADINRGFPMNVGDFISMGLWRRLGVRRGLKPEDKTFMKEALHAVGLEGFEQRPIGTLSGGQMQRALFARLLMQDAQLILLDEPFTAIDAKTTQDLITLILRWHEEGRTILAVLHDYGQMIRTFPETLLIAREVIAWGATHDVLSDENITRARHMVEAFDPHAPFCER